MGGASGVVLTGVYGVGKSSVVEAMAELLEIDAVSYGAIDVDWLSWFDVPGVGDEAARRIIFSNLKSVTDNYLEAGVMRFLLAWSIRDQADLEALRDTLTFPLRAIHLTASIETIRDRLAPAVTVGRQQDLHNAERLLREGTGSDVGEVAVANDRPIREVATEILNLLEWR